MAALLRTSFCRLKLTHAEETVTYFKDILNRNGEWRNKTAAREGPDYFHELATGQTPKVLWISCSDSRVVPEHFAGFKPGEIFVHRNIANIVYPNDMSMQSVLQFAVQALKIEHIVICGHSNCGGVAASCRHEDLGTLDHWIRGIRDVSRLHHKELDTLEGSDHLHRLVELNVVEQARNIIKTGVFQEKRKSDPNAVLPSIHGFVFEIERGLMKPIRLGLEAWAKVHGTTYKLHEGAFDHLARDDAMTEELIKTVGVGGAEPAV